MGIRFRRSVKIGKGVKINFGKTGASVSVGTKGFHHTIHTSGKRTTSAGIPGTGLSYVKTTGGGKKMAANKANKTNTSAKNKKIWLWVLGWIIIFPIPLTILVLRSSKLKKSVKIGIIAIAWLIFLAIAAFGGGGSNNSQPDNSDTATASSAEHVEVLPEQITIDSIELQGYKNELFIAETTSAKATISPSGVKDKTLTWASSDETVATVDAQGKVTAVGGGTATISATASNGKSASFDVNVDGTKTLMQLSVKHPRVDDVNIGSEWSYQIEINGERVSRTIGIGAGEILSFYAQFTESDKNPDVGSASATYTVTEDDIANGFEVTMDLYVTENGGPNSGKSAHFVVTYSFSPNN